MGVLLIDDAYIGGFQILFFRAGLAFFLLLGFLFFYFTVFRLKRIDINNEFVFISSYYTNVKYPIIDIDKIKVSDYGILHLGKMTLKGKGVFGDKISFIASQRSLKKFLTENPEQMSLVE